MEPGIRLNSTEFRGHDLDADGFEEILISAPYFDENDPDYGEVHIHFTSDPNASFTLFGQEENDGFAFNAVYVRDVSGDGMDDIAVAAPFAVENGQWCGRLDVFRGTDGVLLYSVTGFDPDGLFGYSIASVSDLDNDGVADLIVSAPHGGLNAQGHVFVLSGVDGAPIRTLTGQASGDLFGWSVASAGDVNSDGKDDILIGAPRNNVGGTDAGRAYVYSGSNGALLFTITGDSPHDHFGTTVAGGVDFNADGRPDAAIGAPDVQPCPLCPNHGRTYLFHLPIPGIFVNIDAADADVTLGASTLGDYSFGHRLQIGNDVTNDGVPELIIAAIFDVANEERGRAYVIDGTDGSVLGATVGDETDPEVVGGSRPVIEVWDCPWEETCPEACDCVYNAIQRYNAKMRSVSRKWWLLPLCAIPCAAICCPPLTAPAVAACVICLGAVANETILDALQAAEDLELEFIECFSNAGCLAPPFPYW